MEKYIHFLFLNLQTQASAATKTPISYLNELCRKAQLVAKYDIEATEDLANGPLFVFKVSAGSIIATGKGKWAFVA